MSALTWRSIVPLVLSAAVWTQTPLQAQHGAAEGEWHYYGGDAGNTKYSPLDEINTSNVKELQIAWRWSSENFGPRADFNLEVTPLKVGGVLYFTAGARRDVFAVDAVTGETLWMYRLDEGARGLRAVRRQNRGVAYWTDGQGDERILYVTPGYQLIALNAKDGRPIPGFGKDGIVELTEGLDREVVEPGRIGLSSPPIVVRDVAVVGAAFQSGTAPASKENVPGHIRGYDVRTGEKLWTFRTIPHPGEFGNETWEDGSWEYTGNTGAWGALAGDEELGYVYLPVEMPTGDYYGGHRPGDNLFSDSVLCLEARTGKRIWHYQLIHHDIWDWDIPAPPILADITVDGKQIKALAQVTKQAFTYVFDRATGEPVWPIVERPVPQSDVPGEKTSPTQPFPTKPPPFDVQGVTEDDLIDFTPELRAEAVKIASQYVMGPIFQPPIVRDSNGKLGTLTLPKATGGANWPGGAFDPETGMLYVASVTDAQGRALSKPDPRRSDMAYVGGGGRAFGGGGPGGPSASGGPAGRASRDDESEDEAPAARSRGARMGGSGMGPRGLPLVKPPWGRITAIDLNKGEHVWMIANGDAPDYVKENPAMKGIDLSQAGKPEKSHLLVTKTLLFAAEGAGLFNGGVSSGDNSFRAIDKKTGEIIHEMELPASSTGIPMTYMANDRQYIVIAVGAVGHPGELVAYTVP